MSSDDERSLAHWRNVPWDKRFMTWAYPVAIVQDRYGGTYSGGVWIAVAKTQDESSGGRIIALLTRDADNVHSPWGSDTDAMSFWASAPSWIAAGSTPETALSELKRKNADVDWPFKDKK